MKTILRRLAALALLALLTLGLVMGATASQRLTYGWLCWSDEKAMLSRDSGAWTLHVERVREYLCGLANAGIDEVRILPYGVWGSRPDGIMSQFNPYVVRDGRFDLATFNDHYFQIVRRFIEAANEYGIRVRFCWLDNCQLAGNYVNPWEDNVQGIYSPYDQAADRYLRAWILRCLDEFTSLNVSWAFGNENTPPEFVGTVRRVFIPIIRERNLDPSRLAYGASMTSIPWDGEDYSDAYGYTTQDLARAAVSDEFGDDFGHRILREVHGCGVYLEPGSMFHQSTYWWADKPVGPFELSDDGEWTGASLCDSEGPTRTRPSPAQWKATIEASREIRNLVGYEHLPKGGPLSCQVQVLSAMYKAIHGQAPPHKYDYTPLPVMVQVAVCPDSGLRPNRYCPRTEIRGFEEGKEPVEICGIHKATDCRCSYWLTVPRRPDIWRWLGCIFGGPKRCK